MATWKSSLLDSDDELLCSLMEGQMVGKPARGRRLQTLVDLYENNSSEVLKRTELHGQKVRERKCQKPAVQ